jgi:hypothetical protein
MRKGLIEWGVVVAILGLISLPFAGPWIAGILLGAFVLMLLVGTGALRWLQPHR